jgi:arylsulfatase A-like enzyme
VKPNILVILTEDLSPHSKTYGDTLSPLKSIDEIAREALIFENAFCTAPVCSPSRFSLITGMEPASCAPAQNHSANGVLPSDIKLLTQPLREAGYYCVNYSKADYNFEANMPELWDDYSMGAHWRNRGNGQPFFAFFNLTQTHESSIFREEVTSISAEQIEVPPYLPDTLPIREDFARYYTAMQKSEEKISQLLSELKEDGLLESTVIVQISDHGGSTPRSKRFNYDSGNKVPLIINIPNGFSETRIWRTPERISTAVSLIDFAPTICDLAGVAKPETMIGKSLLTVAKSDTETIVFTGRDRMDENFDLVRTARTSRFLYIRNYFPNRPLLQHQAFAWQARGYQSWEEEYLDGRTNQLQSSYFGQKPAEEFYDTHADPHQVKNLIDDPEHIERIRNFRKALDERTLAIFDNGFIPEGSPEMGLVNSRNPEVYPLAEVLELANLSIQSRSENADHFAEGLTSKFEVIRFWSAQGLLLLGEKAASYKDLLIYSLNDQSDNVKTIVCELLVLLGERSSAIEVYRELLDSDKPFEILIRTLKSLAALLSPPVEIIQELRSLESSLREPSKDTSGYFNAYSATRYLIMKIEGTYKPSSKVFDNELFMDRMRKNNPELIKAMGREKP